MALDQEIIEVKTLLKDVNSKLAADKQNQAELGARLQAVEQLAVKLETGASYGNPTSDLQTATPFNMIIGGAQVKALASTDRMVNHFPMSSSDDNEFSLSHFIKANLGIEKPRFAVTTGPALVPTYTSGQIIDAVRANSSLIQAGAVTIPLEGKTNLCRIDGEPVVYIHQEGEEDISESTPVLSPVELNPPAFVAVIPLTQELVQDSLNLDAAIHALLGGAFGSKLDMRCLANILADLNIPTSAIEQNPNSWQGVLSAVGSAMLFDQQLPLAHISNPADYIGRASELGVNYGWLSKPELLKNMLEIANTGIEAGSAVFGNFAAGFGIGVRSELQVEVVRFAKYKSYTHVLVAHLRADGYVLQPNQLFVQQAISSGL